ncbi:MAG: hypothetical protein H0Z39_11305 [Peptococcaceae bacterium]|nr:hypothetical protein [Peptococcaceae bacterium]
MKRILVLGLLFAFVFLTGCGNGTDTIGAIQKKIEERDNTFAIIPAPNEQSVAFAQGEKDIGVGQMYLWQVGAKEPTPIDRVKGRICDFYWSPNSKYVIADMGTSVQRQGSVVSVDSLESIADISYFGTPYWSPNSEEIALGVVDNETELMVSTELSGTVDLVLYNVVIEMEKTAAKGTSRFYCEPIKWKPDGTLVYRKVYVQDHRQEMGTVESVSLKPAEPQAAHHPNPFTLDISQVAELIRIEPVPKPDSWQGITVVTEPTVAAINKGSNFAVPAKDIETDVRLVIRLKNGAVIYVSRIKGTSKFLITTEKEQWVMESPALAYLVSFYEPHFGAEWAARQDHQKQPSGDLLEVREGTLQAIRDRLKAREDVYAITLSPNEQFAAFVLGDTQAWYGQMYLWQVGNKKPTAVEGVEDRICKFFWSPDSNYVLVDAGTGPERTGYIVAAEDFHNMIKTSYAFDPQWSPDSQWIAFSKVNDISPIAMVEPGSVDLVVYNVKTKEQRTIAEGTEELCYMAESWDKNGTLTYKEYLFADMSYRVLTFSLSELR